MAEKRTVTYRISVAIIAVLIVAYTIFHMVSLFSAELSTVVVAASTEETRIEFDGYIFRDESVVYSSYGGAVDYIAHDGLKLATGEALATVYEHGNSAAVNKNIDEIDAMIEIVKAGVSSDMTLSQLPTINENIDNQYHDIMTKLASGDVRELSKNIDSMTSEMCKKSVLTDEKSPVEETLKSLYAERERIAAAGGDSVTLYAEKSGYFYSGVDGYESFFTRDAAAQMTPDTYQKYTTLTPQKAEAGANPVGRMVYDSSWAFLALVSEADAAHFEVGEYRRLTFTGGEDVTMPLLLTEKIADTDSKSVLLKFECDRMPSGFDFTRAQSVSAVVQSVTGITVPKSATHKSDGYLYVYILRGSVVFERRIEVIYEGRDYYTVADGLKPDGEDVYLQSNDTLILDGQNLFDGRILD